MHKPTMFLLPYFLQNNEVATEATDIERTKYNVSKDIEKRTYEGIVFASVLEMKYYRDVVLPQLRSGEIKNYELQKEYVLQPKHYCNGQIVRSITYVADFFIEYADGRIEVIDTKGCPDSVAKIKKKMFTYQYPEIPYHWITYVKKWGGWRDFDEINQLRKEDKKKKKLDSKKENNNG